MIDFKTEDLIPFEECGKLIPGNPSRCTLYRWALRGCRGTKLETLLVGSKRFVSREAIARFIAAQNADAAPTAPAVNPKQRKRQAEAAMEALAKAGV